MGGNDEQNKCQTPKKIVLFQSYLFLSFRLIVSTFTNTNHSVKFWLLRLKRRGNILVVRATIVTLGTAAAALRQKMKIFPK